MESRQSSLARNLTFERILSNDLIPKMPMFKVVQNFREIQVNDRAYSKVKTTAGINYNAKITDLTGDDRATAVAFSQIANILPNIVQGQYLTPQILLV